MTIKNPSSMVILNAWHSSVREQMKLTYLQFYTPLNKSFSSKPFQDHPFLLTLLLGREYVQHNPVFASFFNSIDKQSDYLSLQESINLQLCRASSRCELAVTGQNLRALLKVNLNRIAGIVKNASLLVQVSISLSIDVIQFSFLH